MFSSRKAATASKQDNSLYWENVSVLSPSHHSYLTTCYYSLIYSIYITKLNHSLLTLNICIYLPCAGLFCPHISCCTAKSPIVSCPEEKHIPTTPHSCLTTHSSCDDGCLLSAVWGWMRNLTAASSGEDEICSLKTGLVWSITSWWQYYLRMSSLSGCSVALKGGCGSESCISFAVTLCLPRRETVGSVREIIDKE